ncbi:MAG: hypothetical protein ACRDZ1_03935 [Acidimicrobiia bacterium]
MPISSGGAPAPSDAGVLGASLLDSALGDVAATLPEPSSAPGPAAGTPQGTTPQLTVSPSLSSPPPSPPATMPVDEVTVSPTPVPPPPTVSTPVDPPEAATPQLTVSQLSSPPPAAAPVDPPEVTVPQVPSPPVPGEPPVAPSGGVPISSGGAPARSDTGVLGASLLDGAFTNVIDAVPSGEPAPSGAVADAGLAAAGPTGGVLGGVADALTNVTSTVSVPYVGWSSGGLAAASPTEGTPTQPVEPPVPPDAGVLGASLLGGALNGVADALTNVIDAMPSGEPAPSGAVADAGLAAASPTAGALSSVAKALTNATGTSSGGGRARSVGAASGVAVNGGATASSEPNPFDPGDPTNVLALLGMLDAGAVAVGCVGGLAAGLPATPSCGQLAASGAENRTLATIGAVLVGIGSFLRLLRRRPSRGLGIDTHPNLGPVGGCTFGYPRTRYAARTEVPPSPVATTVCVPGPSPPLL